MRSAVRSSCAPAPAARPHSIVDARNRLRIELRRFIVSLPLVPYSGGARLLACGSYDAHYRHVARRPATLQMLQMPGYIARPAEMARRSRPTPRKEGRKPRELSQSRTSRPARSKACRRARMVGRATDASARSLDDQRKGARAWAAMAKSRRNIRFRASVDRRSRGLADRAHAPETRSRRRRLARRQRSGRRGDEIRPRSLPHELSSSRPPLLDHRRLRRASALRRAEPCGASGARRDRVDRDGPRGFHPAAHAGDRARADPRRLRGRSGSARGLSSVSPASRSLAPA